MTAVNLKTLLTRANRNNYSVAGLVVISWEDAIAYTEAAHETKIPIILQAGPSCRQFTPVSILGKMFRHLAEQTKTPICCHLDHGFSYDECIEGIESGFTSVMFDGSKLPLNKNIKISSKISNAAIIAPGLIAKRPTGIPGILCMPKIELTGNRSNKPSSIIALPPPSFSSAG